MMIDKNYRLSMIIPTYNVESFIEETLLSCLNQDIGADEYEIICIDDGSSDGTVSKIEALMQNNINIKLFTQENSGVSATRNRGINLAQGNYIWFIDSDDLIAANCVGTLLHHAEKYDAQKLLFGMQHFTSKPKINTESKHFEFCDNNKKMYDFTYSHGGGGVCRNLYKIDYLKSENILFNKELSFSEDILFDYKVLINCTKCVKTTSEFYYYRQHKDSAIHSSNFDKHIASMHLLTNEYLAISRSNVPNSWKNLSKRKSIYATKALLFSLIQKGDIEFAKGYIKELESESLYPYPFLNILFNNKTFKESLISWISFLFPLKWYFMLCVRISCLKNKLKK